MPEDLDNLELQEPQDAEPQESEGEEASAPAKEENRVPVRVVKELRDELRQAREDGLMTRKQLNSLMSEYSRLAKGQTEDPQENLDPEIQKLIKPYLRPLQSELEDLKQSRSDLNEELRALRAERYIEANVPNLNALRPHIAKFIQSEYTPEEQAELTPKEVVRIAKLVSATTAKSVSRSMAKAESGTTPTRTDGLRPSDLSGDKLQAYLQQKGFFD